MGISALTFGFLVLALIALSALFSGSETAVLVTDKVRLRQGRPEPGPLGVLHRQILTEMDRVISTILIGNNLVNVTLSALATAYLQTWSIPYHAEFTAIILTPLILIFGEVLPKEIARRKASRVLHLAARPLLLSARIFRPATLVLNGFARGLIRALGHDPRRLHPRITLEDLRMLVRGGSAEAPLDDQQRRMIHSAFSFSDTSIREIMVPLMEVYSIPRTARVRDVLALARSTRLTRFPVHDERVDHVVGVINVNDLLYAEADEDEPIRAFLRQGFFIPFTTAIDKLLLQMQNSREPLALVVDEYGGFDGLVTVKDIVEEVLGEYDTKIAAAAPRIVSQGPDVFVVDGHFDIDKLNDELDINLPKQNYETLAGFILSQMDRIPKEGESCTFEGIQFTVSKVKRHAIAKVIVRVGPTVEANGRAIAST